MTFLEKVLDIRRKGIIILVHGDFTGDFVFRLSKNDCHAELNLSPHELIHTSLTKDEIIVYFLENLEKMLLREIDRK